MASEARFAQAVAMLRKTLERAQDDELVGGIVAAEDEVTSRYGKVFSLDRISDLTEEEFRGFLRYENNRHWGGLHRQGGRICADMGVLRDALARFLDEERPLHDRLNHVVASVKGLGKAIATAILLVTHPRDYGVWNNTSEGALRKSGIWPEFDKGTTLGERYVRVNEVLNRIAAELGVNLWTLDTLCWYILQEEEVGPGQRAMGPVPGARFGLERHLHDFLRDNWEQTELGQEHMLYEQDGEEVGYEYPCGNGWSIDLLAQQKNTGELLVIELKRDQTGDATVGQVLRYMGWVRRHLAKEGQSESVRGLIIARHADAGLLYAVDAVPDVDIQLYEVTFHLRPAPSPGNASLEADSGQ